MNWTKFSVATLLGGIVYFLLGWLVYGILLKEAFTMPEEFQNIMIPDEEFKISLMAISCLVWAALLTYIFQKWAGISTFMGGMKGGALIGALVSLSVGLGMASMYKFGNINNIGLDTVANAVCSGITGGVIGWWLGRGND